MGNRRRFMPRQIEAFSTSRQPYLVLAQNALRRAHVLRVAGWHTPTLPGTTSSPDGVETRVRSGAGRVFRGAASDASTSPASRGNAPYPVAPARNASGTKTATTAMKNSASGRCVSDFAA